MSEELISMRFVKVALAENRLTKCVQCQRYNWSDKMEHFNDTLKKLPRELWCGSCVKRELGWKIIDQNEWKRVWESVRGGVAALLSPPDNRRMRGRPHIKGKLLPPPPKEPPPELDLIL